MIQYCELGLDHGTVSFQSPSTFQSSTVCSYNTSQSSVYSLNKRQRISVELEMSSLEPHMFVVFGHDVVAKSVQIYYRKSTLLVVVRLRLAVSGCVQLESIQKSV